MTSSDSLKENQRHNGNVLARSQEILPHAVFMMSGAICSALFSPMVYYFILVYGEARNDAALKEPSKKYSRSIGEGLISLISFNRPGGPLSVNSIIYCMS